MPACHHMGTHTHAHAHAPGHTLCRAIAAGALQVELTDEPKEKDQDNQPTFVQFGFAAPSFTPVDGYIDEGVGDTNDSWAIDGRRKSLWHLPASNAVSAGPPHKPWERLKHRWKRGDVIGFAVNVDTGQIAASLNGAWTTDRGYGVLFADERIQGGVYPAVCATSIQVHCEFVNFRHDPPPEDLWAADDLPSKLKPRPALPAEAAAVAATARDLLSGKASHASLCAKPSALQVVANSYEAAIVATRALELLADSHPGDEVQEGLPPRCNPDLREGPDSSRSSGAHAQPAGAGARPEVLSALRSLQSAHGCSAEDVCQSVSSLTSLLACVPFGSPPPTAYELRAAGTVPWLLSCLVRPHPSEEAVCAARRLTACRSLGASRPLLERVHAVLDATEDLPLKDFDELQSAGVIELQLHQMPSRTGGVPSEAPSPGAGDVPSGEDAASITTPPSSARSVVHCVHPLWRFGSLARYLRRTSPPKDASHDAWCAKIVGCTIEEVSPEAGRRRATVESWRVATPRELKLHTLAYEDGGRSEVVLAARDYRICGRRAPAASTDLPPPSALAAADEMQVDSEAGDAVSVVSDQPPRAHAVRVYVEGIDGDTFLQLAAACLEQSGLPLASLGYRSEREWRDHVRVSIDQDGSALVARRQTWDEAEIIHLILMGFAENCEIEDDVPVPIPERTHRLLSTVHVVEADHPISIGGMDDSDGDLEATVVEVHEGNEYSLLYEDGTFEARVPSRRLRSADADRGGDVYDDGMGGEGAGSDDGGDEQVMDAVEIPHAAPQFSALLLAEGGSSGGGYPPLSPVPIARISTSQLRSLVDAGDAASGERVSSADGRAGRAEPQLVPADVEQLSLRIRLHGLGTADEPPPTADVPDEGISFCDDETILRVLEKLRLSAAHAEVEAPPPKHYHLYFSFEMTGTGTGTGTTTTTTTTPDGDGTNSSSAAPLPLPVGCGDIEAAAMDVSGSGEAPVAMDVSGDLPIAPPALPLAPAPPPASSLLAAADSSACLVPSSSVAVPTHAEVEAFRSELLACNLQGDAADSLLLLWLLERCSGGGGGNAFGAGMPSANDNLATDEGAADPGPRDRSEAVAGLFCSPRLSSKLAAHLANALAVQSGALPPWLELLLHDAPFLFAAGVRRSYSRASAFGASRAAVWWRKAHVAGLREALSAERQVLEPARDGLLMSDRGGDDGRLMQLLEVIDQQFEQWDEQTKLATAIARVRRAELLPMAKQLIARHVSERSSLEVQFQDETYGQEGPPTKAPPMLLSTH